MSIKRRLERLEASMKPSSVQSIANETKEETMKWISGVLLNKVKPKKTRLGLVKAGRSLNWILETLHKTGVVKNEYQD